MCISKLISTRFTLLIVNPLYNETWWTFTESHNAETDFEEESANLRNMLYKPNGLFNKIIILRNCSFFGIRGSRIAQKVQFLHLTNPQKLWAGRQTDHWIQSNSQMMFAVIASCWTSEWLAPKSRCSHWQYRDGFRFAFQEMTTHITAYQNYLSKSFGLQSLHNTSPTSSETKLAIKIWQRASKTN